MALRLWPEYKTGIVSVTPPDDALVLRLLPYLKGDPGADGAAAAKYLHTQSSDSATWTVNHNLGVRPLIQVYSIGWVELEASVIHTSENQAIVQFNTANSGFAVCQ